MKILPVEGIRSLDAHTLKRAGISSIDLMERAATTFCEWFVRQFPSIDQPIAIFCGPGNNGGDGLAIARILHRKFYPVQVYLCEISPKKSPDFLTNLERLPGFGALTPLLIQEGDPFPILSPRTLIIDAILGAGLKGPVEGYWGNLLQQLNQSDSTRVAVDIPSGLFADRHTAGISIRADYTFSFELPKLAFFMPENQESVGHWAIGSIGLDQEFIDQWPGNNFFHDLSEAARIIQPRPKFSHKGTFGHALLWVGSRGKTGAGVLAARACMRTGAGLLTVHLPESSGVIVQTAFPEAMVSYDASSGHLSQVPDLAPYRAIGAGCGIGTHPETASALKQLLTSTRLPLVLDADALNLMALAPDNLAHLPANSILTPHPGEFDRLFGKTQDHFERLERLRQKAQELKVIIILKGAHTTIATPEGQCHFNASGNPGMATAGSGDVLTGILTGLLAQGYTPLHSALLGVALHGLAGDLAAGRQDMRALLASDIIENIGSAYQTLQNQYT
jgi:NAD(P)H-hydrate epimerase